MHQIENIKQIIKIYTETKPTRETQGGLQEVTQAGFGAYTSTLDACAGTIGVWLNSHPHTSCVNPAGLVSCK